MSIGFSVANAAGKTISDSRFFNYVLSYKGTLYIGTGGAAVPACSSDCIVFYRCNSPLAQIGNRLYLCSLGSWNGNWWWNGGTTSGTIEYFIFSKPVVDAGNFGIVVYDDKSTPTFSSLQPALKILGVFSTMQDSSQYAGSTLIPRPFNVHTGKASPSGTQMAFAFGGTRVYWTSVPTDRGQTDVSRVIRGVCVNGGGTLVTSPITSGRTIYGGNTGRFNRSPNGGMPISVILADVGGIV